MRVAAVISISLISRRFEQWLETTDVRRVLKKYNPYHHAYLNIGSRFGSGIQALFGFARTLLELNLILAIVWVGFVVVPQALMNDDSHDVMRDFEVTISADPINASARPSLLYFGGYEPVYYNDDGTVRYQMDVAYFLTALLATFGISLFWLVLSIGAMLRARRSAASSSGDQSVGEIVELVSVKP